MLPPQRAVFVFGALTAVVLSPPPPHKHTPTPFRPLLSHSLTNSRTLFLSRSLHIHTSFIETFVSLLS